MKGLYVFRGCDSHSSSNTVCIEYAVNDYRNRYNKQEREHTLAANWKGVELHLVNASFIGKCSTFNVGKRRARVLKPILHLIDSIHASLHPSTSQHSSLFYTPCTVPWGVFMHQPTSVSFVACSWVYLWNHTPTRYETQTHSPCTFPNTSKSTLINFLNASILQNGMNHSIFFWAFQKDSTIRGYFRSSNSNLSLNDHYPSMELSIHWVEYLSSLWCLGWGGRGCSFIPVDRATWIHWRVWGEWKADSAPFGVRAGSSLLVQFLII